MDFVVYQQVSQKTAVKVAEEVASVLLERKELGAAFVAVVAVTVGWQTRYLVVKMVVLVVAPRVTVD